MVHDEHVAELLSASLDGALGPQEKSRLEAILKSRPETGALLVKLAADRDALRALPTLIAPTELKARVSSKLPSPRGSGTRWKTALMAASLVLALGLGVTTSRLLTPATERLHLRPQTLASRAGEQTEEFRLSGSSHAEPHVMLSPKVSGTYSGGSAQLRLRGDAGEQPGGGKLWIRLAFDFDGDGVYDLHSQPQVLQLDANLGHEEIACHIPLDEGMQDLSRGRVKVELASLEPNVPLTLQLDPQQAYLKLPFGNLDEHRSTPS